MLAWLARKQTARTKALETYLSHFDAGELAYLKNITLTGLMPSSYEREDAFINVDVATYIHAEWMSAVGEIPKTAKSKARARSKYRIKLAWDATPIRIGTLEGYLRHILPHRLEEPELNDEEEERLGSHWIVLTRLYRHPRNAPTLPELEDLGEGEAWLPT